MNSGPVTLVIPCYNEASRGNHENNNSFKDRLDLLFHVIDDDTIPVVIFVNDGSSDSTKKVIETFVKENHLEDKWLLEDFTENQGKGKALRKGLELAAKMSPYVAYIDADLSVPVRYVSVDLPQDNPEATVVCGQRRTLSSVSWSRRILSGLSRLSNRMLLGIKVDDTQCPLKIIPSEAYLEVYKNLKGYRWIFDMELLYALQKKGYRLKPVDVPMVNMESVTLSTASGMARCVKDLVNFKVSLAKKIVFVNVLKFNKNVVI